MDQFFAYKRKPVFLYFVIIAGTGMLAFAIKCICDPINLVTGGFTGLSILLKDLTEIFYEGGVPLWFANLALNIPVFLITWKVKGKRFIGRTAIATALLSLWLYVIPEMDFVSGDYTLAAVFGGVLSGISMGMILWADSTTGGTEMVAILIQCRLKHYSVAHRSDYAGAGRDGGAGRALCVWPAAFHVCHCADFHCVKGDGRHFRRDEILQGGIYYHRAV